MLLSMYDSDVVGNPLRLNINMKIVSVLTLLVLLSAAVLSAAKPPPEFVEAGEKRRKQIQLGGDYKPDPKQPVFIAVGHGARILLSRDDGKTWKQAHFGYPGSDHGAWARASLRRLATNVPRYRASCAQNGPSSTAADRSWCRCPARQPAARS